MSAALHVLDNRGGWFHSSDHVITNQSKLGDTALSVFIRLSTSQVCRFLFTSDSTWLVCIPLSLWLTSLTYRLHLHKGQVLKFTEEYDNSIPTSITLAQFTLDIIQQYGDETACVSPVIFKSKFGSISLFETQQVHAETKQSYTYNDIIRLTRQVASGLQSRCSVGKEIKNVAVVLPSSLEYPIVALAINLLGATAAFVNPSQTISKFRWTLQVIWVKWVPETMF